MSFGYFATARSWSIMNKNQKIYNDLRAFEKLKEKQKELFLSIKDKSIIYLDMNYWIDFVKYQKGLEVRPYIKELHELLVLLINNDKALIPICDIHLRESYKIRSEYKYESLINLMEKLSLNNCLISFDQRWSNELLLCIRTVFGIHNARTLFNEILWTKPFFLHGDRIPLLENITFNNQEERIESQKDFIIYAWHKSLSDVYLLLDEKSRIGLNPKVLEKKVTEHLIKGREENKDDYIGFKNLLEKEISGLLGIFKEDIDKLLISFYTDYEEGKSLISDKFYKVKESERSMRLIYLITKAIIESEQYEVFPSLTIGSCLHSLKRWEISSKYEETNLFDIMHAQVALPYCDYFFTEGNLCGLIKDNHIKLDKKFNCNVISKPEEAYQTLKN